MHLAFVTYAGLPELNDDDKIIVQYLAQKNVDVTPVIWDNAHVDWKRYDAIILRSMWD